jgi:hypothetical protein
LNHSERGIAVGLPGQRNRIDHEIRLRKLAKGGAQRRKPGRTALGRELSSQRL